MSSIFSQRSNTIEIMDDLNCNGEVVNQTLRELEFINRTLGGNQITLSGVQKLIQKNSDSTLEVIDLAAVAERCSAFSLKSFPRKKSKQFSGPRCQSQYYQVCKTQHTKLKHQI